MSITLHLDDVLAEELRSEASAESIPPEELARRLVGEGIIQRLAERQWQVQNRRRLELIAKKKQAPLTAEEHEEFVRLQELGCELPMFKDGQVYPIYTPEYAPDAAAQLAQVLMEEGTRS